MEMHEYYATGKRKCGCVDVKFNLSTSLIKRYKQRYRDGLKNLMANAIFGQIEIKSDKCYNARCSQCDCLYLSSRTKNKLIENVKLSGIVPLNKL